MTNVQHARALMGDSLGFHIIFALFGVGLPVALFLIEYWGARSKNDHLVKLARMLSRVMVLFAVIGVVSGTLIAIQMSVFWPGLIAFGHDIIGVPFMLEGYAFLIEAVFLALYVSTWDRVRGMKHVLLLIPVILGSFLSAVCITLVNAWMNDPGGFDFVDGKVANVHVWQGLLTKTAFFEIAHSTVSYYLATFLCIAGVLLWSVAKKGSGIAEQSQLAMRVVIQRFVVLSVVCMVLLAGIGDASLRYLSKSEPRKFAALEVVSHTATHVPYRFGAHVNDATLEAEGGMELENFLSLMTGFRSDTLITGLDHYPRDEWPLLVISDLFEIKMLLVGFLSIVPAFYLIFLRYKKSLAESRVMRWLLIACGPVAIVVVELGWMVTELGRQPYAVTGFLTTADAFTASTSPLQWGIIFPIIFVLLLIVSVVGTRKIIHNR